MHYLQQAGNLIQHSPCIRRHQLYSTQPPSKVSSTHRHARNHPSHTTYTLSHPSQHHPNQMAALKACGKMPPPPSSQTHPAKTRAEAAATVVFGAVGRMCAARHAEESAQLKFAGKCCLLRLQPNLLYCCSHTPSTLCRLPFCLHAE